MTEHLDLPWMPPGTILHPDGRGEFFVRHHQHADPDAPTILLLHGWTASSDLQFVTAYEALAERYSFIGVDHRGHGRGLRTPAPFDLTDVADDAAAITRALGVDQVVAMGYSMGGPISMLLARRHPDLVTGLVVQATALEWNASLLDRLRWRGLPLLGAALRSWAYPRGMRRFLESTLPEGHPLYGHIPWLRGELQRADVASIVEAGRSLATYDATDWASSLGIPAGSLITTKDRLVKPAKQRQLAAALGSTIREVRADHLSAWETPDQFSSATVELIDAVLTASAD